MGPIPWGGEGGVAGPGAYIYIYTYTYTYIILYYMIEVCLKIGYPQFQWTAIMFPINSLLFVGIPVSSIFRQLAMGNLIISSMICSSMKSH